MSHDTLEIISSNSDACIDKFKLGVSVSHGLSFLYPWRCATLARCRSDTRRTSRHHRTQTRLMLMNDLPLRHYLMLRAGMLVSNAISDVRLDYKKFAEVDFVYDSAVR